MGRRSRGTTGENIANATMPAEIEATAKSASAAALERSPARSESPARKNSDVYFDSSAAPTAAPTASHHAPRPVSNTFAREKNSTKLEATSSGESGRDDERADRCHQRDVQQDRRGRRHPHTAETGIAAVRYTAQLIGSASNIDTSRTPNSVSPAIMVPSRITTANTGRMIVIAAGEGASTTSSNRLRRRSAASRAAAASPQVPPAPLSQGAVLRASRASSRPVADFKGLAGSSLAPDEQSGHRVIPYHAHQRAGRTGQPPDRLLIVDRERHTDIGEQPDAAHEVKTAGGRAGSQKPFSRWSR